MADRPPRGTAPALGPRSAARLAGDGVAAGDRFLEGWTTFDRLASPAAVELVRTLDADPAPLLAALDELPATGLHGDLKLSNVAPLADGRIALIDWQMTMLAPVAVELGWLLVGNSGSCLIGPMSSSKRTDARSLRSTARSSGSARPTTTAARIRPMRSPPSSARTTGTIPVADAVLGDWAAQVDLAWIIGLLLRGWRKGTDAGVGAVIGSGVAATDDLGWWCDRAVEAAGRRL